MKQVRESTAAKSISAYVILDKRNRHVATVQVHHGNSCVAVDVWHNDATPLQQGSASDYGYDKFAAALSGLTIDGHKMSDHCGERLKPPRGKRYFPLDYKPRKGYRLANYGQYDATGKRRHINDFREAARAQLGDDASFETIDNLAREMQTDAQLIDGYDSCYRLSGLDYLTDIGYKVIGAI